MSPAEAHAALAAALAGAVTRGEHVPCRARDAHLFTSDSASERAEACELCADCPVRPQCAAAGEHEAWHVWGAVDCEAAAKARRARRRGRTATA